jgi:CheY-like chemotaxis protein
MIIYTLMKTTIAIADDNDLFRERFSELLTSLTYDIIIRARNGRDLLEQISHAHQLPDVCIIDHNMPVMNGTAATRTLKQQQPSIIIIGYSMSTRGLVAEEMLAAGADHFILKENYTELKETLAHIEAGITEQSL